MKLDPSKSHAEQHSAKQLLDVIADSSSDAIFAKDREGRYLLVNPETARVIGKTAAQALGQDDRALFPLAQAEMIRANDLRVMADSQTHTYEETLQTVQGECTFLATKGPLLDAQGQVVGLFGISRDITARKQAEARIVRLTQVYAALSRSNEAIVRSNSAWVLFPKICQATVQSGGVRMAWIGWFDEVSQCIKPVASYGPGESYLTDIRISIDAADPCGQGPSARALRDNQPQWCQDFLHDPATAAWHEQGAEFGWAASAALPLHQNGVVVGTFNLYAGTVNAFDEDNRHLLLEMATNISFALDGYAIEASRKVANEALRASEERNRSITRAVFDAIITSDSAGNIAGWNLGAELIFGYKESEVMGQPMTLLMPDRFKAGHLAGMNRMQAVTEHHFSGKSMELSGLRKVGTEFPMELTLARWQSSKGWFITGVIRDITERKAQQAQLKVTAQVFAQGKEGIAVTDASGNILMTNAAFTRITGYTEAEVLGKNPRILASGRQSPAFYGAMWEALRAEGQWAGEIWNRRKEGTVYPEWLTITAMRDAAGQTTHYVGNFSDLSDAKAAESRIQWLSHFDVLTGLPNRTLLQARTESALNMAQRANEPMAMMMIGIDHFKSVNDTLGYLIGDELLLEISKRLSSSVRDQDTVARLGGKEFVLVLPDTPASGAAHLASDLLWKLAQPYQLSGHDLTLTASIGLASFPENGADFNALFKSVEIAMHRAQASGRDSFQFYSEAMYQQVMARDLMTKALRHAIELDQLALVYQPLVDLQTGQISGMEALLRWVHPELGSVSPVEFIPLAEESGLIKGLGEWVLRQACRDIRGWLDKGIEVPHVAVNVSPLQFRDSDLMGQIRRALAEFKVAPERLYIEVTESALMDDVPRSEAMLNELKELGLKLSLDDFGTGYSSLSYLKRFPFDKVKIDQSFVRDITSSQSDQVLVKVIISMAHGLGLKVIAEGVETEAQCEIMRTSVCDEIQGFYFSRPISAQAIEALFSQGRQLPPHLLRLKKPQRTLLLVDDEPNILSALKRLFRRDGHAILTANSGPEGLEILAQHKVDVIISDQRMPGMTGVEFLRKAKINCPDTIRIVLSGYTELQSVTDAINEGAVYRFLTKPWEDDQLREHVQKAFEYKELLNENQQLDIKIRTTNQELIAANRQLGEVLEKKHHQIERDRTSLAIAREVLQHMPLPVIGVDDEGQIAFVNAASERLFSAAGPILGSDLAYTLPNLQAAVDATPEGEWCDLRLVDAHYTCKWNNMGVHSAARGKIITLNPTKSTP